MVGLPVFAYVVGLTYYMWQKRGFLIGLLAAALVLGELADRGWGKLFFKSILAMMIGMITIYFFGILQLSFLKGFSFGILSSLYPFIIGDLYKYYLQLYWFRRFGNWLKNKFYLVIKFTMLSMLDASFEHPLLLIL